MQTKRTSSDLLTPLGLMTNVFVVIFLLGAEFVIVVQPVKSAANPEAFMHPISLINYYGYPAELHEVVTEDGHLLELHRIPGRDANHSVPVVLQHGILSSSADFIANKPPNNLACVLWDYGYDVWLSNTRGNRYSNYHTKYEQKDARIWDFSLDELARFDVTAVVSYVKRRTGFARIHYIGHSQGTQSLFALLSIQPEFGQNIRLFTAMAPVTSIHYSRNTVLKLRPLYPLIKRLNQNGQLRAWNPIVNPQFVRLCQHSKITQRLCSYKTDIIYGRNDNQRDTQRSDVYFSQYPMDTSLKNVEHLLQLVDRKGFRMFDYGQEKNLQKYGVPNAPEYPLHRIRDVRIALFFAPKDDLVEAGDVEFLMSNLRPDVLYDVYRVSKDPQFNHVDFTWGMHAKDVVWNRMINNMKHVDEIEDSAEALGLSVNEKPQISSECQQRMSTANLRSICALSPSSFLCR